MNFPALSIAGTEGFFLSGTMSVLSLQAQIQRFQQVGIFKILAIADIGNGSRQFQNAVIGAMTRG